MVVSTSRMTSDSHLLKVEVHACTKPYPTSCAPRPETPGPVKSSSESLRAIGLWQSQIKRVGVQCENAAPKSLSVFVFLRSAANTADRIEHSTDTMLRLFPNPPKQAIQDGNLICCAFTLKAIPCSQMRACLYSTPRAQQSNPQTRTLH